MDDGTVTAMAKMEIMMQMRPFRKSFMSFTQQTGADDGQALATRCVPVPKLFGSTLEYLVDLPLPSR